MVRKISVKIYVSVYPHGEHTGRQLKTKSQAPLVPNLYLDGSYQLVIENEISVNVL